MAFSRFGPILTFAGLVLAFSAGHALAQCQNQSCAWRGDCFICVGADGFGCAPAGCGGCMITKCQEKEADGDGSASPAASRQAVQPPATRPSPCSVSNRVGYVPLSPSSTMFAIDAEPGAHASLIEATFSRAGVTRALVRNSGPNLIHEFRIARIALHRDGRSALETTPVIRLEKALAPGATTQVPPFLMSDLSRDTSVGVVVFFVKSTSGPAGESWQADPAVVAQPWRECYAQPPRD